MEKRYVNTYHFGESSVTLRIHGLRYEATITIELEDFPAISKLHWGIMAVGKKGHKKLVPYTSINRFSIPLGRWLLNVTDTSLRVEHRDRNNHNFLRSNLYVTGRSAYKQHISKHGDSICGVIPIKSRKNSEITGYKVEYKNAVTHKKDWMCFTAKKCGGIEQAKKDANQFKLNLVEMYYIHIA